MADEMEKSEFAYEDLREWIKKSDAAGNLRRVEGASWEADIGNITEMLHHSFPAPAVLFDKVPGCDSGYRVLTNALGSNDNIALSMGLPGGLSKAELSEAVRKLLAEGDTEPMKYVDTGPVMENVETGNDIDLYKFPTPLWHEQDGGRYIGTASYDVTSDPDRSDWINIGTYRVMLQAKDKVGFYISPGKHGRVHRDKHFDRGEACPVAMVFGGDPLTFLMASTELPSGMSEYDFIGGLRGEPVEVIRGPVTGLPFPANAEIVIEGYARPGNELPEGPFGEWTGYYASSTRSEPVVDVEAVYYRNDPVLFGSPPNRPPDEQARFRALIRSALLREEIERAGVPGVTGVWAHEAGGTRLLLGVSIDQRYGGHSAQAGHVAAMCHVGAYTGRYVVVVDDDIDVTDLEELTWAMCTRSEPAESIDIIQHAWSTPLDPRIPPERKQAGDLVNSRAIIDATRPFHWRDRFPAINLPSRETMEQTRKKWGYLRT